jgi:hypothetical protein
VQVGSVLRVPFYSSRQASAYSDAVGVPPPPDGPMVAFHVVGIEATEFEFPSGLAPSYNLYTTPAFARTVLPRTALGFVGSQIVATVTWQATAIALVGVVVGIPLGTVLGRGVWAPSPTTSGPYPSRSCRPGCWRRSWSGSS